MHKKIILFFLAIIILHSISYKAESASIDVASVESALDKRERTLFYASNRSMDYGTFKYLVKPETVDVTREILKPLIAEFDLSEKEWLYVFTKIIELLNEELSSLSPEDLLVKSAPVNIKIIVDEETTEIRYVQETKTINHTQKGKRGEGKRSKPKSINMKVPQEYTKIIQVEKTKEVPVHNSVFILRNILKDLLSQSIISDDVEAKVVYSLLDHLPEGLTSESAAGAGGPMPEKSVYASPKEITENINRYLYALSFLTIDQRRYGFHYLSMCRGMNQSQINELWSLRENWWDPEDPATPMDILGSIPKTEIRLQKARINIRGFKDLYRVRYWEEIRNVYGIRE